MLMSGADASTLLSALFGKALTPGLGLNIRACAHGDGYAVNKFYRSIEDAVGDPELSILNATLSIYFGMALRDLGHEKPGTKNGCTTVPCLWADLDAKDYIPVADKKNVTIEERAAGKLKILEALATKLPADRQPSAIIDSGGGYQPLWFLREPLRLGVHVEVEDMEATLRGLCTKLGVGASRPNVDSIMRMPGTINRKYPDAPVAFVHAFHAERRYSLDDFAAYRETTQATPPSAPGSGPSGNRQRVLDPDAGRDFPALLVWLRARGWVGKKRGDGYDMTCPWGDAHTSNSGPTATRLTVPTEENGYNGGFDCKHQHCTHPVKRRISDLYLMWLAETAAGESQRHTHKELEITNMSGVVAKPINWLWPGRIPRGELTLVVGDPSAGKTMTTEDIAVRLIEGKPWPTGEGVVRGPVVYLTVEDNLSTSMKPRLEAMGSTGEGFYAVTGVQGSVRSLHLVDDLAKIEALCQEVNARMLVVSPVNAYLGGNGLGGQGRQLSGDGRAPGAHPARAARAAARPGGHRRDAPEQDAADPDPLQDRREHRLRRGPPGDLRGHPRQGHPRPALPRQHQDERRTGAEDPALSDRASRVLSPDRVGARDR
jgi:AAA domain-containing protein